MDENVLKNSSSFPGTQRQLSFRYNVTIQVFLSLKHAPNINLTNGTKMAIIEQIPTQHS